MYAESEVSRHYRLVFFELSDRLGGNGTGSLTIKFRNALQRRFRVPHGFARLLLPSKTMGSFPDS